MDAARAITFNNIKDHKLISLMKI